METLIAKDEGKSFTPHPEGAAQFVCADVHDEGYREGPYGTKREIRLVFVSEFLQDDGRPFEHSQWFTLSLHEKSNLSKFLESWRGTPFTDDERHGGWDIMKLMGANAYVQIVHKPKQTGGVKATISSIMKLPPKMQKMAIPTDFARVKDRVKKELAVSATTAPKQESAGGRPWADVDDLDSSLPF